MPQREEPLTFMIEDAHIFWRNFAGKEGRYNQPGERNFLVNLDEKTAQQMLKDGWSVKWPDPKNPDEDDSVGEPFIQVSVNFKNWPPRIVLITSRARTNLDESTVEVLDWTNIQTVDLICRAYNWNVNGKSGIKAYLKSMFVTIDEDFLERKYAINEMET